MRRGVGVSAVKEVRNPDIHIALALSEAKVMRDLWKESTLRVCLSVPLRIDHQPQRGCQAITQVARGHQYKFVVFCLFVLR